MKIRSLYLLLVAAFFAILVLLFCYDYTIKTELDIVEVISAFINAVVILFIAHQITRHHESERAIKTHLIKKIENLETRILGFYQEIQPDGDNHAIDFRMIVSGMKELRIALSAVVISAKTLGLRLDEHQLVSQINNLKRLYTSGKRNQHDQCLITTSEKREIYRKCSDVSIEVVKLINSINTCSIGTR